MVFGYFKESDGDWFFIPAKLSEDWDKLSEAIQDTNLTVYLDNCEEFEVKFSEFRIDGSPDSYLVAINREQLRP